MLNLAVRNTGKLIRAKSKSENVRLGRLFTKKDTARLMADMATETSTKSVITVLDAGAGTGILSAAVIEAICEKNKNCVAHEATHGDTVLLLFSLFESLKN